MGKKLNIAGEKYGKLTAVCIEGMSDKGSYLWKFKCDCGGEITKIAAVVRNGNTSSCGCLRTETLVERNTTHSMSKHPAYSNWKDMFKRCYNPNNKRFKDYQERGIEVDSHFEYFPHFLAEIGEKPDDIEVWTVGRIDNNKSYEPGNVRWETRAEQARNHSMQRNNTSGIVGVQLQVKVNPVYGEYTSFVACWNDETGRKRTKNFSTNKYGFEEAKQMAISYREKMLEQLVSSGVSYADSHGTQKGVN